MPCQFRKFAQAKTLKKSVHKNGSFHSLKDPIICLNYHLFIHAALPSLLVYQPYNSKAVLSPFFTFYPAWKFFKTIVLN